MSITRPSSTGCTRQALHERTSKNSLHTRGKGDDVSPENSFSGKGVFPPKYAFTLLIPFRNIFLSPKQLIHRLALQDEHTVLEIGPGPGYFSTHVAQQLKRGKLVLLDIQQEMLDYAKRRLDKRGITNVDYLLTDGARFDLASKAFDRVFMVTVLGEVANQETYLQEIHRILKDDGIVSISELAGDPDKMSIDQLHALTSAQDFETTRIFGNRFNYTINLRKRGHVKSEPIQG
ncbi:hypothetical protein DPPLL_08980 [Desulfofustis limnaeus]|jgi:ubiquinone/menaquinone biosynthesis C-methylase UbiE|uniref:Methyltransferase domain-containing protein n=2 Tax=Desulfofustis limnaeus TaxID=2740163 RepID=A0ABM7W6K3_9BACT|nr:class I SAM-dependent methyltransferase [Desulfofustis limnaeus]BDD86533.1 hypothetical protein DPPLL_08980 [Desulfofustis limnaeus]